MKTSCSIWRFNKGNYSCGKFCTRDVKASGLIRWSKRGNHIYRKLHMWVINMSCSIDQKKNMSCSIRIFHRGYHSCEKYHFWIVNVLASIRTFSIENYSCGNPGCEHVMFISKIQNKTIYLCVGNTCIGIKIFSF